MQNPSILIVEDEKDINNLIAYHLEKEKYKVKQALSAEEAMTVMSSFKPDLMILDIMLPHMSGFELCQKLANDFGILMLTARSSKEDIVKGLNLGADDYVTKPFEIKEVIARVKAILRRKKESKKQVYNFKDVKIDLENHSISVKGKKIHLTLTEFNILKIFLENCGRVLTREHLLNVALGMDKEVVDRNIDVHILSIRRKLGSELIETIRGVGYRWLA